jgi:thiol-disulfide isomerase/thioredoxin
MLNRSISQPFNRSTAQPLLPGAALALLVAMPAGAQDQIGLPLGVTPPAVTVADLDGNPVDLGQWIGKKPVVIEFWATWCPLCETLLPKLEAARNAAGESVEFLVVAVGVNQSVRSIRRHVERHPVPGRLLWDGKGNAVRAFEAPSTSYVVILDGTGKVVYTGIGEDQDIGAALGRVKG